MDSSVGVGASRDTASWMLNLRTGLRFLPVNNESEPSGLSSYRGET